LDLQLPIESVLITTNVVSAIKHYVTGRWFFPVIPDSSTKKETATDITEVLLKVVLNTIKHQNSHLDTFV
jgi:hypothetical protein